jgi:hypothetical protein
MKKGYSLSQDRLEEFSKRVQTTRPNSAPPVLIDTKKEKEISIPSISNFRWSSNERKIPECENSRFSLVQNGFQNFQEFQPPKLPSVLLSQNSFGTPKVKNTSEIQMGIESFTGNADDDSFQTQNFPTKLSPHAKGKSKPIWKPLTIREGKRVLRDQMEQRKHKNLGKVAINMDSNLSSSTDDLLKLAGVGHLQNLSKEEDNILEEKEVVPESELALESRVVPRNSNIPRNEVPTFIPTLPINSSEQNLAPIPMRQVCRYFSNGYCSRGDRCNFLHVLSNVTLTDHPGKPKYKPISRIQPAGFPLQQYANLNFEECVGEIYSMCLDQHGCRYLQKQLDSGNKRVLNHIFEEVIEKISILMKDPFGNYLCQKLVEHCDDKKRLEIVKGVSSDLVLIAKNIHGTRAVQRLIDHLHLAEEIKLTREALKGSVVGLIQDLNGNHVIQKCLHKMEPNDNQFIYDAVARHCVQVATHRHGCCVLQRCIDHGTLNQKKQLVEEIKANGVTLVQDAFGNYVVQYILDLDLPNLATDLIIQLQGEIYRLAKQKFSSNVVEKCLKVGDANCVKRIMRELLIETKEDTLQVQDKLLDLLQDSYGNYVIQTCLSEGVNKAYKEYKRMVALLSPYVQHLRNTPYSKRIQLLLNLQPNEENTEESHLFRRGRFSSSLPVPSRGEIRGGQELPNSFQPPYPIRSSNHFSPITHQNLPKYRR